MAGTAVARQRRLGLTGAVNFRDLGGYDVGGGRQTRWGVIFRADSLADLTEADFALIDSLRLHTLIDFRVTLERMRRPNRLPPGHAITTVEIGFLPNGALEMLRRIYSGDLDAAGVEAETLRHYRAMPIAHRREYGEMFDCIDRAEGRPVLIHCTSGKDRTGFGAALILLALGATREVVLDDYALTNQYRRDVGFLFSRHTPPGVVEMLTAAQPKYLEAALATIDAEFGSVDRYLERTYGLDAACRARLRTLLTEPVQPA